MTDEQVPSTAAGSPEPAPVAAPATRGGWLRVARWLLRGLLAAMALGCLVLALVQGRFTSAGALAKPAIIVEQGPAYGQAVVLAFDVDGTDRMIVEVAPGVSLQEVERGIEALGDTGNVPVVLRLPPPQSPGSPSD